MSHDQQTSQANQPQSSPSSPSEYYASSAYDLSAVPERNPDPDSQTQMQDSGLPVFMRRWAARAPDSQFNAMAGAIGGFTSGIVTCPLDVIKTKLQAQVGYTPTTQGRHVAHPKLYNGLIGTARVIWAEEGIRGMYRGLGPIVMGYLPTWAVWFTVYNESKTRLVDYSNNVHVINFWSSIIAGASSTIVTNPIWVIKTRLMSQSSNGDAARGQHSSSLFPKTGSTPTARPTLQTPWHYTSTIDAARKMYTSEGIASFYSGLTPALLGLTHVAVQFPTYEFLKTTFTGQGMGETPHQGQSHWGGILSASILSKILASTATYPHEVIRTRLQTQRRPVAGEQYLQGVDGSTSKVVKPQSPKYQGVVMTFRTILKEEGWRAFYAGLGTNMTRAVPAATVTMLTYEFVMEHFKMAREEGQVILAKEEEARV